MTTPRLLCAICVTLCLLTLSHSNPLPIETTPIIRKFIFTNTQTICRKLTEITKTTEERITTYVKEKEISEKNIERATEKAHNASVEDINKLPRNISSIDYRTLKHTIASSYRELSKVKYVLDHFYDQDQACELGNPFDALLDTSSSVSNVLAYLQLMRDELFHNDPTPLHDVHHNVPKRCAHHINDNLMGMMYSKDMFQGVRALFCDVIRVLKSSGGSYVEQELVGECP